MSREAKWKLKRTTQCDKCPWKKSVNPHDIPNGYDVEKHKALRKTIAEPGDLSRNGKRNGAVMACHEIHDAHCIGWLLNQLGSGNNLPLRLRMLSCENGDSITPTGEQHACFEDTLPKKEG